MRKFFKRALAVLAILSILAVGTATLVPAARVPIQEFIKINYNKIIMSLYNTHTEAIQRVFGYETNGTVGCIWWFADSTNATRDKAYLCVDIAEDGSFENATMDTVPPWDGAASATSISD
jgi:hypothetical protein